MKKSIILMAVVFITAMSFNLYSQPQGKDHPYKAMFDELRNNVQTYTKTEIIPVMKDWKLKLDHSLATADLQQLNDLRQKATEERNKMRQDMKQDMKDNKGNKKEIKEDRKNDMKDARSDFKELFKELKPLAEKYKDVLQEIGKDAQPKVEVWKDKIKTIFEDWKTKYKDELEKLKAQAESHGKTMDMEKRFGKVHDFKADFGKPVAVARFMLWDGTGNFMWENPNKPPNPKMNNK